MLEEKIFRKNCEKKKLLEKIEKEIVRKIFMKLLEKKNC